MFYFSGPKHTTPNCPIDFAPDFNPSTSASYGSAGKDCKQNAHCYIPFFLERPGPKYEEWSTSAHEGRPGHHTQVSRDDKPSVLSGSYNSNNRAIDRIQKWRLSNCSFVLMLIILTSLVNTSKILKTLLFHSEAS